MVNLVGGGNRSTGRKAQAYRKSPTSFMTCIGIRIQNFSGDRKLPYEHHHEGSLVVIGYSGLYGKDNLVLFSPYIVVLFLFLVMYSAIDVFNIKMIIFNNDFTLDHVSDKTLSNMDTN
jgi:hypothetical protein